MTNIFISYRRSDSPAEAGRIRDRLESRFGRGTVFFDVSDIRPGEDFKEVIDLKITKASALLVVVGPLWHARLAGPLADGEIDFVRYEIKKGLEFGVPIIPVLLKGVEKIDAAVLPSEVKPLVWRQSVRVSHESFEKDMESIISAVVEREREIKARQKRRRWSWLDRAGALLLGGGEPVAGPLATAGAGVDPAGRRGDPGTWWPVKDAQGELGGAIVEREATRHQRSERGLSFRLENVGLARDRAGVPRVFLNGLTLFVQPGDFMVLMGGDMNARQALLNVLALRELPTRGQFFVDGRLADGMSVRDRACLRLSGIRYVGRVPDLQSSRRGPFGAWFGAGRVVSRTVEAFVRQDLDRLRGVGVSTRDAWLTSSLKAFDLWAVRDVRLGELDRQQIQNCLFARAVVTCPSVLVVEGAAIWLAGESGLMSTLQSINAQSGMTVIYEMASKISASRASKVVRMESGEIHALGMKIHGEWHFVRNRSTEDEALEL